MWGFQVGLGVNEANQSKLPRKPDLNASEVDPGTSKTLQRSPNQSKFSILDEPPATKDGNAVAVSRNKTGLISTVVVDGLTIVDLNGAGAAIVDQLEPGNGNPLGISAKGEQLAVIATGDDFDAKAITAIYKMLKPRLIVVNSNVEKVSDLEVEVVAHNTVAVSLTKKKRQQTRVVSLGRKPHQLSEKLTELFEDKEAACEKSRSVFAKLSVDQMNFKPSNGTHTPRWNTEHMMGRELMFFSQIYHAVDQEIPVMNLNPAQMPNKYKFAHPDWTGAEEARQTGRVEAFTRRFAYLLDGMSLNRKAKGSRFWTPKSLLLQMKKHYKEHTDNVIDKMKLAGWPKE